MFKILLMISNYFHDLAVALLATNILVIYFAGRYLDRDDSGRRIAAGLIRKLTGVSWIALGWILIGGGLRAWWFMDFEWNPAVGNGQVAALVVKHLLLLVLTIFGASLHVKYYRKYGH